MASGASKTSSIRMGPISLFTLIILICLAVMSVLIVTTAQATYNSATKQQLFTTDTYANETAAQELVATIDDTLAPLRESGANSEEAMDALRNALPAEAEVEDNEVRMQFVRDSGRALRIVVTIEDNLDYSISNWQAITNWNEQPGDNLLWTG